MIKPENNTSKGRRILIDEQTYENLSCAVIEIKNLQEYSKINEGKLAVEILNLFFKKYYLKDKNILAKKFFNKRTFLRSLLQKSKSDEDILKSLDKYMKKSPKKQVKENGQY